MTKKFEQRNRAFTSRAIDHRPTVKEPSTQSYKTLKMAASLEQLKYKSVIPKRMVSINNQSADTSHETPELLVNLPTIQSKLRAGTLIQNRLASHKDKIINEIHSVGSIAFEEDSKHGELPERMEETKIEGPETK